MIKDDERKKDQHRIEDFPAEIISWIGLYLDYPSYKSLSVTNKAMYCTMWGASANAYSKHIEKQPEPPKVDIKAELMKLNNGNLSEKNIHELKKIQDKYLNYNKEKSGRKRFISEVKTARSNIKNKFKLKKTSYNSVNYFCRNLFKRWNILELIEDSVKNDNASGLRSLLEEKLRDQNFPKIAEILKQHGWEMDNKESAIVNFYKEIFFLCILTNAKNCIKMIDEMISLLGKDVKQNHETACLQARKNLFLTKVKANGKEINMIEFMCFRDKMTFRALYQGKIDQFLPENENNSQFVNKNYITPTL